MKGYSVHLLFHLLAVLAGAACGIAAGLWLFGDRAPAVWPALGALLVGVAVLAAQSAYLRGERTRPAPAGGGSGPRRTPEIDIHHPDGRTGQRSRPSAAPPAAGSGAHPARPRTGTTNTTPEEGRTVAGDEEPTRVDGGTRVEGRPPATRTFDQPSTDPPTSGR